MPTQFPPRLYVDAAGSSGRGVFTAHDVPADRIVFCDPVALIEFDALRDGSIFGAYSMAWSETHDAIAFGLSNLLNHSDDPNVECVPDFDGMTMICRTLRPVRAGEELVKRYVCGPWWGRK